MVIDEVFDVAHDFRIALMGVGRDRQQFDAVFLIDCCGLRVQNKGDCE